MFDDLDDGRAHGRDERIGVRAFDHVIENASKIRRGRLLLSS